MGQLRCQTLASCVEASDSAGECALGSDDAAALEIGDIGCVSIVDAAARAGGIAPENVLPEAATVAAMGALRRRVEREVLHRLFGGRLARFGFDVDGVVHRQLVHCNGRNRRVCADGRLGEGGCCLGELGFERSATRRRARRVKLGNDGI